MRFGSSLVAQADNTGFGAYIAVQEYILSLWLENLSLSSSPGCFCRSPLSDNRVCVTSEVTSMAGIGLDCFRVCFLLLRRDYRTTSTHQHD